MSKAPAASARVLVHGIVATADLFLRESQRIFRPHGLSAAQFNVLNLLAERADGVGYSQRELADALLVDRSNVTGLVDRMTATGWVCRVDDVTDRRVYRIQLTEDGRRLWSNVAPIYAQVVSQVTECLSTVEITRGVAVLAKLQEAATRWSAP
jgi:DNA-binding MarR family transcriptional regulator